MFSLFEKIEKYIKTHIVTESAGKLGSKQLSNG